jgi:hypothetical protein
MSVDPQFVDPADGDYHLRATSPCVNAGDPAFVPEPGETDIDGEPRVQQCRVDMGADETAYFVGPDCNNNNQADACDISSGASKDCNKNWVPDECDIASGTSDDSNGDGIPDECQVGDMNCDGSVDFDDINPFVSALVSCSMYLQRYPNCRCENADINCDRYIDFDDIDPFVACLVNAACDPCPH